jgi:ferritin-like metal-binding protein YciE
VLQAPFKKHEQETRGQVKRLERVFKIIAARAIALALPSWVAP